MTSRVWTPRPLTPDDRDGILDLFRRVFGEEDATEEWWDWKYLANPAGPAFGYLAEAGTEIVGLFVLFPRMFQLGGRLIRGARTGDVMVHPSFRRQGMFRELVRKTYDMADGQGVELLYSQPNANSQRGLSTSDRYNDLLPSSPVWFKPLLFGELAQVVPWVGPVAAGPARLLDAVLARTPRARRNRLGEVSELREVDVVDSVISAVAGRVALERSRVQVVRNMEYYRWRYALRPNRVYKAFACVLDRETVGYAVCSIRAQKSLQSGFLCEFEVLRSFISSVGPALIDGIAATMRAQKVAIMTALAIPSGLESRVFGTCGFFLCPRRWMPQALHLGYRVGSNAGELSALVTGTESWYLSWGDNDVV